ncbi:MAG: T9SS type A sorting domain-containing protein [Saprospirales bacterium]|nr:T9SS type A sorting domain-containing protein [Saprospirales bacterium]
MNCKNFEIERMDENNQFVKIGEVNGSGNSSSIKKYTFDDREYINGDNYYRLKQNDFNGNYQYSDIVLIKATKEETTTNTIKAWINQQTLSITATLPINASVYNLNGQLAMSLNNNETQYSTDLSSLPNGVYVVYTTDINGNKETFKIIK